MVFEITGFGLSINENLVAGVEAVKVNRSEIGPLGGSSYYSSANEQVAPEANEDRITNDVFNNVGERQGGVSKFTGWLAGDSCMVHDHSANWEADLSDKGR